MKNVLLTGVSKGLGLKTAELLLQEGHTVYGISRTCNENILSLKKKYQDRFIHKGFDLNDTNRIKEMWKDNILSAHIQIHSFINNAAIASDDLITNIQLEDIEKIYRVNVFSPLMLCKYAIRNMLLNKIGGSIVHVSSISAHTGYKGLALYASTKGALEAFSKNTAREWGEKGIRSNCVVAGFMETDMSNKINNEDRVRIFKRTSLKTPTSIDSVAQTIRHLISENSQSITGQCYFVDSGTI